MAANQEAPYRTHTPAPHDQEPHPKLLAELDDLVGGPSPPEMGLHDRAPCLLNLPYLLVEYLLSLALELPFHEAVAVGAGHVVPDVDDVQLRTALPREIRRGRGRLSSVLGAVAGQKDLGREHAHPGLLLRLHCPRILPTSHAPRRAQPLRTAAGSRNWRLYRSA